MTMLRDIAETFEVATAEKEARRTTRQTGGSGAPVGGPSAGHARSVLEMLRSRLRAQIDEGEDYESAETRAIRADARYRLTQVEDALARLDEGKYGQCVDCAGHISPDRLVIQPFTTRCLGCQDRHDRKVRRSTAQ